MSEIQKFSTVKDAILKGLKNIDKWYRKVNDTDAFFICLGIFFLRLTILILIFLLALDLNIKTAYSKEKWQDEFYEAGLDCLGEVVSLFY